VSTNTAEIIDLAAYRGRRAEPAPGAYARLPDSSIQAIPGLMMMPVPVFFVWPMAWFQIPVTDDA
jgi:hypothetical protein